MSSLKETSSKVMNAVNSLKSAVEFFYDSDGNISINLSDMGRINAVNFVVDFLKQTKGEDYVRNAIAEFIAKSLPYIEATSKGILYGYLLTLQSCSVSPIITEKMILDGVYFDLQKIDLFNKLDNEPVINYGTDSTGSDDKPGKYLYFGCNEIETFPELVNCRDFDAFLWYTKNCPGTRNVWRKEKDVELPQIIRTLDTKIQLITVEHTFEYPKESGHYITVKKVCYETKDGNGITRYYTLLKEKAAYINDSGNIVCEENFSNLTINDVTAFAKQAKSNGVVTIEYNAKSSGITDAEHNVMDVLEPVQNSLHVFVGCCNEISPIKETIKANILSWETKASKITVLDERMDKVKDELESYIKELKKEEGDKLSIIKECKLTLNKINDFRLAFLKSTDETINEKVKTYFDQSTKTVSFDVLYGREVSSFTVPDELWNTSQYEIETKIKECNRQLTQANTGTYPSAKSNYYYLHPLAEFNYDLIYSMKWFDEKIVAAQLINAIIGCLEFGDLNGMLNLNISLQKEVTRKELETLIEKIIENDDDTVSDCFFTFSNDKYNEMLQSTEMKKAGIHTMDGKNAINTISPSEVFESLNALSSDATKEDLSTAIEHSIFKATANLNTDTDERLKLNVGINGALGIDFDTEFNIIEVLIKKLIYVIVSTFLMPKIYMIIMFNYKLYNDAENTFDLQQYITYLKSMLVDLINAIKDLIIDYFKDLIEGIIRDLLAMFKQLMIQEQYAYYKELLAGCVECFKQKSNDWDMDNVTYADITEKITSVEDEC